LTRFREDPDPGIHAAAEWTLRRYERASDIDAINQQLAPLGITGERQWYVNRLGHTMVVVPGPAEFMMGSPPTEAGRGDDETLHRRRLPRSFSIASKETTVAQYERFLRDNPHLEVRQVDRIGRIVDAPLTSVTWYEAAAYCNWLSQQEDIPQDQWCYLPNADGRLAAGMQVAPDFLYRRGYRLPTEAEWEYACRARATSSHFFGTAASQVDRFAVFHAVSVGEPQAVGTRKPNDFGLFDMHGNVAEWCQDRYQAYPAGRPSAQPGGSKEDAVADNDSRVIRGGSVDDALAGIRSAARAKDQPTTRNDALGFRVARSFP
jgi:formylglycine-generating enzyme required for sulfatase activity